VKTIAGLLRQMDACPESAGTYSHLTLPVALRRLRERLEAGDDRAHIDAAWLVCGRLAVPQPYGAGLRCDCNHAESFFATATIDMVLTAVRAAGYRP
jgi:hypothetical protein